MTSLRTWLEILIAAVALLNVAATLEAALSPFLRNGQRVSWLAFIWLVPIIGAVFSLFRAWRRYRGLDRSLDGEIMADVADLTGVPVVGRPRGRSSDGWDGDTDD
ncbi:hypothetical protein [Lysobacter sp. Root916]|uniref:hypothetical protein n=1 Tax=Lysobacter sp. Root916 TaxID=1736606 RepID=UPI0012FAD0B5|nr:hypothetical protein [Lysobacter sp. Root916]